MKNKSRCWKKIGRDESGYDYLQRDNKYSYAKVWKTGLSSSERKRRGIHPYFFSGRVGREGETIKKNFKKIKEAKLFAKKWMDKRNTC